MRHIFSVPLHELTHAGCLIAVEVCNWNYRAATQYWCVNQERASNHHAPGGFSLASNSATFASKLSSRARVRARTTIWLSNSSRLTRSSLLKPLCNKALNWLSISSRGNGVSPLNKREAWLLRVSRKALGASMVQVPDTRASQCTTPCL